MPLGLAAIGVAIAPVAHAKEYDIAGTVGASCRVWTRTTRLTWR